MRCGLAPAGLGVRPFWGETGKGSLSLPRVLGARHAGRCVPLEHSSMDLSPVGAQMSSHIKLAVARLQSPGRVFDTVVGLRSISQDSG